MAKVAIAFIRPICKICKLVCSFRQSNFIPESWQEKCIFTNLAVNIKINLAIFIDCNCLTIFKIRHTRYTGKRAICDYFAINNLAIINLSKLAINIFTLPNIHPCPTHIKALVVVGWCPVRCNIKTVNNLFFAINLNACKFTVML